MSALGSLVVKLALEYAQYTGGLDKSEQATLASMKRIQGAADQFSGRVVDGFKTAAASIVALFGAGALAGHVKAVVDELDRIADAAPAIGVSVQTLGELGFAASMAGSDALSLEGAMGKLNLKVQGAINGNKEAKQVFSALGVSITDASGKVRATDDILADLSETFRALPEGPTKSALAVELFGKSGAGMVQFLSEGRDGIQALRDEFKALAGGDIERSAEIAGAFNDQLDKLAIKSNTLTMSFGSELLPLLTSVAEEFTSAGDSIWGLEGGMQSVAGGAGALLRTFLETLLLVGSDVVFVFAGMGRELGGIAAQAAALATLDWDGVKSIRAEMIADGERAAQKLKEFQDRIANGGRKQEPVDNSVEDSRRAVSAQARADAEKRAAAALREADAAAKAAEDAYKKLMERVQERIHQTDQELALGRELTEAEKFEAKAKEDLGKIAKSLSAANLAAAQSDIAAAKKKIEQAEIEKQILKELTALAVERQRVRNADYDSVTQWMAQQKQDAAQTLKSIHDRLQGLKDEEEAATLAREKNIGLAEAIERVAIARLRERQEWAYEGSERWNELQAEIEAREKLLGLLGKKEVREREEKGWTDMWSSVDQTAHDVFTNVLDGGMSAFKRLGQTLKASVLDVLYQMTVRRWIVNIGAQVLGDGFGQAGNAATNANGGGIGSLLSNNSGLIGAGLQAWGGYSVGASAASLGAANMVGAVGGDALGALIAGNGGWAGVSAGAGAAGGAAGAMGGAMSALGTAMPYIGLGLALTSLLSGLDGSGDMHAGGMAQWSAAQGRRDSNFGLDNVDNQFRSGMGWVVNDQSTVDSAAGVAQAVGSALDAFAAAFGQRAGYEVATGWADDGDGDGSSWGALRISRGNEDLLNWNDNWRRSKWAPREFSAGEEGRAEYMNAIAVDAARIMRDQVSAEWAKERLEGIKDLDGLQAALSQIGAIKTAFTQLGESMGMFADLSDDMQTRLLKAAGSMEALSANAGVFYEAYYTEGERMDALAGQVRDALGSLDLSIDPAMGEQAKQQFRGAVEQAMAAGNAELVNQLLAMSGTFAAVADYAAQQGADQAVEQVSRVEEILAQQDALWADLAEAQGDHARAAELRYAMETAGMTEAERAAYDYIAAIRAQVSSAQAAAQALSGLSDSRFDLENQLLELQGKQDEVAARTRARDLEQLTKGMSEEDAARVRAAYDYNAALRAQITTQQAAQAAAQQAQQAEQQAAQQAAQLFKAWQSIGDGMVAEIRRIKGLLDGGGGESSLAQAQADFAIATAQARAGDQDAAQQLPALSRALLELAESNATTRLELQLLRASTGNSLADTAALLASKYGIKLPAFAAGGYYPGGMALVGEEGPEIINFAQPGQVYTAAQSRELMSGGGNAAVVEELRGVRRELDGLRKQIQTDNLVLKDRAGTTAAVLLRNETADGLKVKGTVVA